VTYLLARLNHVSCTYEEVRRLVPIEAEEDGKAKGSSLRAVAEGCRDLGLNVVTLRLSVPDLLQYRPPYILHLSGVSNDPETPQVIGHYVLVLALHEHEIVFIDPARSVIDSVPRGDFMRRWSGYIIVPTANRVLSSIPSKLVALLCGVGAGIAGVVLILVGRRYGRGWRRWPGAALALCLGCLGCSSGDSASTSLTERGSQRPGFELTVMRFDADVGVLPVDGAESKTAFSIWNSGSVPVQLSMGPPSCTCSTAKLQKSTVEPGDTVNLELGLRRAGNSGIKRAGVQLAAVGHDWSYRFSVAGVAVGLSLPTGRIRLSEANKSRASSIVSGAVYVQGPDEKVALRARLLPHTSRLQVAEPILGEPERLEGRGCARSVVIPLQPSFKAAPGQETTELFHLVVEAETAQWSRSENLEIEVVAQESSR
jgi:hypothetical protein